MRLERGSTGLTFGTGVREFLVVTSNKGSLLTNATYSLRRACVLFAFSRAEQSGGEGKAFVRWLS